MWKKKSIFWELPYWEVLDVRHAIDVMHLTKNFLRQPDSILGSVRKDKRYSRSTSRIATYQGYEINGNTFYTIAQDNKSTNQNSGVRMDATDNSGKMTHITATLKRYVSWITVPI